MQDIKGPIDSALEILRDGLVPFAEQVLAKHYTPLPWLAEVNKKRPRHLRLSMIPGTNTVYWSPDAILNTIVNPNAEWNAFKNSFKPRSNLPSNLPEDVVAKGWIEELLEIRKRAMHQEPITEEDVHRFISTAERVLRAAGAHDATNSIQELLRAHRVISFPEKLIELESKSTAIRLVRDDLRGLDLDGSAAVERISPAERVRVAINLDIIRSTSNAITRDYGLILVVDPNEVICLQPSARIAPSRRLTGQVVIIPDPQITKQALRFRGTLGRHILLALLTTRPLPEEIYERLGTPQPRGFLDLIAAAIKKMAATEWQLIKMEFDVG